MYFTQIWMLNRLQSDERNGNNMRFKKKNLIHKLHPVTRKCMTVILYLFRAN